MASRSGEQENPLWVGRLVISAEQPDKHLDWTERKSKSGALPDNKCLYRCIGDTFAADRRWSRFAADKFLSGAGQAPEQSCLRVTQTKSRSSNRHPPETFNE